MEDCRIDVEVAIVSRLYPFRRWRHVLLDLSRALPGVGRERGNKNKCRYLRIVAGFSDDVAAVAVAYQNYRAGLSIDDGLRELDVFGERSFRVLHHRNCVSVFLENVGDGFPSGAISKGAVHQADVLYRLAALRASGLRDHRKRDRGDRHDT